jgi:RNA methyltransferase, TrmH family
LGRRSARWDEGAFVVEGLTLVNEAIAAGWEVLAQFVAPGGEPAEGSDAYVYALGRDVIERVASTDSPQPLLAVVKMPVRTTADLAGKQCVVVCDRIADPGNLGTILRSSEAAGVDGVVMVSGSVDLYNPKVVRASAGAMFHVPVVADAPLPALKDLGLPLIGTSSHQGLPYFETDLTKPFALVLGSEAHGVSDDMPVDQWITIPHGGRSESLNVAMAGSIVVFEALRQRSAR